MLPDSWKEDPLLTLRLIFYKRNSRNGEGNKLLFEKAYEWLINSHLDQAIYNLYHVVEYGSFKDLAKFLRRSDLIGDHAAYLFSLFINNDIMIINNGSKNISLAAKWAPSIGCSDDRNFRTPKKIAHALGLKHKWQFTYRNILSSAD